jgi:DNA-binding MarR family transcriptional regulator
MDDWDAISFVIRSEYRKNILFHLATKKDIPSNIAEETGYHQSHVSNTLSELREKDLVERLVESPKGRIYALTEKGEEVVTEIDNEGL